MIYAFVLGRVYTLAIAEVLSVVEDIGLVVKNISASEEVLLVEFENVAEVDILKLQKRLGGTVKVLKLHDAISLSVAEEKPTAEFFVEALEKIGVDFTFRALSEALQIEDKKNIQKVLNELIPEYKAEQEKQRAKKIEKSKHAATSAVVC